MIHHACAVQSINKPPDEVAILTLLAGLKANSFATYIPNQVPGRGNEEILSINGHQGNA